MSTAGQPSRDLIAGLGRAVRAFADFAGEMRKLEALLSAPVEVTFIPAGLLLDNPTAAQLERAVQDGKRAAHPAFVKSMQEDAQP